LLGVLILDYGNVLSHPQREDWFEATAAQVGAPRNDFRDAYWQHRQQYDAGLPAAEYWRRVLETLGKSSEALEHGPAINQLIEADVASWTKYREEMWVLAIVPRRRGAHGLSLEWRSRGHGSNSRGAST
jgi:putative hydrolase of the HAD superfamily